MRLKTVTERSYLTTNLSLFKLSSRWVSLPLNKKRSSLPTTQLVRPRHVFRVNGNFKRLIENAPLAVKMYPTRAITANIPALKAKQLTSKSKVECEDFITSLAGERECVTCGNVPGSDWTRSRCVHTRSQWKDATRTHTQNVFMGLLGMIWGLKLNAVGNVGVYAKLNA